MTTFLGVVRYEYRMAVCRWGMWLAFALAGIPYALRLELRAGGAASPIWQTAGLLALDLNVLVPIVGGIVLADRLARDRLLGVRELLASVPLSRRSYVLGKYFGAVLAVLTPVLASVLLLGVACCALGAPLALIPAMLVAFLAINVPTYLFIGAFSLACPAVLPVRVYQVLFVGYWFWGNFLTPTFVPTVSDTWLNAAGKFAAKGFFLASVSQQLEAPSAGALTEAIGNIVVLVACAAAALFALERYLAWQERRA